MRKLPEIQYSPAPLWQHERLGQWLREWEIEHRLVEPEGPEDDGAEATYVIDTAPAVVEGPEVHLPMVGQIRLLRPEAGLTATRPVYIALLARCDQGRFAIAPYGRFAEPAIPGELKTDRREPCLQVLCLWNTQQVSSEGLARSWLVGELAEQECDEAAAILRFIETGTTLPDGLRDRLGPPLVHPADPRHEYLEEEGALVIAPGVAAAIPPRTRLARAAEYRARYGTGREHDGDSASTDGNSVGS